MNDFYEDLSLPVLEHELNASSNIYYPSMVDVSFESEPEFELEDISVITGIEDFDIEDFVNDFNDDVMNDFDDFNVNPFEFD